MKKRVGCLLVGVLAVSLSGAPEVSAAAKRYSSCKKMHVDYPNGVGKKSNPSVYAANRHLDRDKDGWACEVN